MHAWMRRTDILEDVDVGMLKFMLSRIRGLLRFLPGCRKISNQEILWLLSVSLVGWGEGRDPG